VCSLTADDKLFVACVHCYIDITCHITNLSHRLSGKGKLVCKIFLSKGEDVNVLK